MKYAAVQVFSLPNSSQFNIPMFATEKKGALVGFCGVLEEFILSLTFFLDYFLLNT